MQQTDFTHQPVKPSHQRVKVTSHRLHRARAKVMSSRLVSSPTKPLRWLTGGLVVFLGLLLTSWLISAGIPSLFISPYPKVILIVPAQYQTQPITQVAVIFLHQRSHRTKSWFVTSQTSLRLESKNLRDMRGQVSQAVGLAISDIVVVDDTEVTTQFRWQLFKSAVSHWQRPAVFWQLFSLAMLAPSPQIEQNTNFIQWGDIVARELQPMETASTTCSIGVSNTTGQSGLGKQIADFLSNQGAVVRRVTDSETSLVTTQVLVDQDQAVPCQAMQTALLSVLPVGVPVSKQAGISQKYRVPLIVLIGSDSATLFTP